MWDTPHHAHWLGKLDRSRPRIPAPILRLKSSSDPRPSAQKRVRIGTLDRLEPIFHRAEQVEVTGRHILGIGRLWHANHPVIPPELSSGSARVNRTVIDMNYQWSSTVFRTSKTKSFVKRCRHMCNIVLTVHSAPIRELIDNMEPWGFHMIVNMNMVVRISLLTIVATSSLATDHIRRGDCERKNQDSSPVIPVRHLSWKGASR